MNTNNTQPGEQQRKRSLRDTETKELFVNLLQIMTPSEKVWQLVVCRILTRLFILWLLTETKRDRNNHRQERSAMKRGPEENYDDCSSEICEKICAGSHFFFQ